MCLVSNSTREEILGLSRQSGPVKRTCNHLSSFLRSASPVSGCEVRVFEWFKFPRKTGGACMRKQWIFFFKFYHMIWTHGKVVLFCFAEVHLRTIHFLEKL